jgi:hypothetical protein
LENLLLAIAAANDIAKVYGEDGYDHAEKSAEYLEKIIEENNIQLSEDVKSVLINSVKYHHINFSDPKAFSQKGKGYFEEKYFPFVLATIAADFLSIAMDMIVQQLTRK